MQPSALSTLDFPVAGVARLQCVEEKPNSGESGYHWQPANAEYYYLTLHLNRTGCHGSTPTSRPAANAQCHLLCSGRAQAVRFCVGNSAEELGGLRRHR
jgi:hypothetical protein